MTLERPMFPPRADSQIIEFSSFAAAKRAREEANPQAEEGADEMTDYQTRRTAKLAAKLLEIATAPKNFSETCKNSRLRLARRDAWWAARGLTDYLRARMDWHAALHSAQSWNVPGADSYPQCTDDFESRGAICSAWREALTKQMLTPAPDAAAIAWKRTALRSGQHKFTGVKTETIERSIAADVAWLAAHPTRRQHPAPKPVQS